MTSSPRTLLLAAALCACASLASGAGSFAPFEEWKAAVAAGDQASLARLYSSNPPAKVVVGRDNGALADEQQFWAGLKSAGVTDVNAKLLDVDTNSGKKRVLLRVHAMKNGQSVVASMVQIWEQRPDGWRITATRRTDFAAGAPRRLPEPVTPNPNLYPEPSEAEADLKAALVHAGKEHKRVLVMFGGNWCYDCHVLDNTFHSKEFAPLLDANYVLVHINIGEEGKDNNDMAARMGAALDKGVPSLAVLDPDGNVVVAQKNGEFESTVKIGPEEVRAFLEQWKPART
ncbi:MAG TPA: thioredoxin family protein [Bryobacteraceae bacterium]|nr:thioredoxin family protein [Bryobacteraceae bacterium]